MHLPGAAAAAPHSTAALLMSALLQLVMLRRRQSQRVSEWAKPQISQVRTAKAWRTEMPWKAQHQATKLPLELCDTLWLVMCCLVASIASVDALPCLGRIEPGPMHSVCEDGTMVVCNEKQLHHLDDQSIQQVEMRRQLPTCVLLVICFAVLAVQEPVAGAGATCSSTEAPAQSSCQDGCHADKASSSGVEVARQTNEVESSYTTLVTGFFSTPGNSHRAQDTYISYMKNFLPLISTPMVIYTSKKDYDLLAGMRGNLPATFRVYDLVWELPPAAEFRQVFAEQLKVPHPEWAEDKGCAAPECSAVWNSKPWMLAQAAAENVYNSSYFMWVDIGSFRWGEHSFKHWPAEQHVQELAQHEMKVAIEVVNLPNYINVLGQSVSHFVAGGWFGGSRAAVEWYAREFADVLRRRHAQGSYVAQEQSIMGTLLLMQPDKFIVLHEKWVSAGGGMKRDYEDAPGSSGCKVWYYLQFHVQLALAEELLMHANTAGCQRVPYHSLQPVVTDFVMKPVS